MVTAHVPHPVDAGTDREHGDARLRRATTVLRLLLVSAFLVSVVHYVDNTVRWDSYEQGQGGFVQRWMVPTSWVLFTAAGVAGYVAWTHRQWPRAAALIGVYSASGLISPLHFTEVSPSDFSGFQNAFVVLDTLAGIGLLAFAVWLALTGAPDGDRTR